MAAPFLPIIDMSGMRAGDAAALSRAAAEINAACVDSGFFYISDHGVDAEVIGDALEAYRRFFHLPQEEKAKVAINAAHRGFSGMGGALMYEAKKPDYKEFYTVGLELGPDDPDVRAGQALRGANNWPDLPGFREPVERFYREIGACGEVLLRAVAVSLDAPADFFESRYRKRLQRTQGIYYPPQPPVEDLFGVADHSDFGCITLLWQDDAGGLEVLHRSGDWIAAPPVPGTLVINVGDLLARWTNDRFASTRHRVVNRSGRERFSIATFYDPSYDAIVDPRQLGVPDAECHYEPVAAGDHIIGRIKRSFGYRKLFDADAAAADTP